MAQPITWQNVNGPNLSEALRPLQAAQSSFNGAFSGLGDILKERSAIEAANAVQLKQNNTQSFLDQVAQLGQTPEQLQAALQSGQVNQLRASYGNDIDKAATRGAGESLLADRYKQVQAATEFGNTMLNEKTAPIMDRFKQASLREDEAGKEAARAEYAAAGGKHGADLESFAQNTARDNLKWNEQTKQWVRDEKKFAADILHMQNQDANAAAQTAIAGRNAAVNEADLKIRGEEVGFKREDRAEDRIAKVSSALGDVGSRNAASAQGTESIYKAISQNIKNPKTQENARVALGEILLRDAEDARRAKQNPKKDKDGKVVEHIPLTTAAAMAAVLSIEDTPWYSPFNWQNFKRDNAGFRAREAMKTGEAATTAQRDSVRESTLYEQLKRARDDLDRLRANGQDVKNPFE